MVKRPFRELITRPFLDGQAGSRREEAFVQYSEVMDELEFFRLWRSVRRGFLPLQILLRCGAILLFKSGDKMTGGAVADGQTDFIHIFIASF